MHGLLALRQPHLYEYEVRYGGDLVLLRHVVHRFSLYLGVSMGATQYSDVQCNHPIVRQATPAGCIGTQRVDAMLPLVAENVCAVCDATSALLGPAHGR